MRDGSASRFDPDAGIAEAWSRFKNGTYKAEDVQLFRYEYFESRFGGLKLTMVFFMIKHRFGTRVH